MPPDDRIQIVSSQIHEFVRSPSLRHLRDPCVVGRLAQEIVRRLDGSNSAWKKWNGPREALLKSAALCWEPAEEMTEFLNSMEGPRLTVTDVSQRLRAFHDEPYSSYPNEELQAGCLELFSRESSAGTELPAIVGALEEYVEAEETRLRDEREAAWRARAQEERGGTGAKIPFRRGLQMDTNRKIERVELQN